MLVINKEILIFITMVLTKTNKDPILVYNQGDTFPSSLLDPSWVQVSQTTELFGTQGTLPSLSLKGANGRAEAPRWD